MSCLREHVSVKFLAYAAGLIPAASTSNYLIFWGFIEAKVCADEYTPWRCISAIPVPAILSRAPDEPL